MTSRQSDRLNELLDHFGGASIIAGLVCTRTPATESARDAILAFVDAELKAAKRSAKRTETT